MNLKRTDWEGRRAWCLSNDVLTVILLEGGGHLASVTRHDHPNVNPLWTPVWPGMEPWQYRDALHAETYELQLLAALRGHNVCLGWFGDCAESERRYGHSPHGEAGVTRWREQSRRVTPSLIRFSYGCTLPLTGMTLLRTLCLRRGSDTVEIEDRVRNDLKRELPFTMAQHVTLGPPFLEKGVTLVDMSATEGHTWPGVFEPHPRLKPDTAFCWPEGPGIRGEPVDLRQIARRHRRSSDFSTQLMDPCRDDAWFSAAHPEKGVVLAYHWSRHDYPWVGNWEENYGRTQPPWNGRSLTRGLEFSNTPFPTSLRAAVCLGRFHDTPTYAWLGARETRRYAYRLSLQATTPRFRGVSDVQHHPGSGLKLQPRP